MTNIWDEIDLESITIESNISNEWVKNILTRLKVEHDLLLEHSGRWLHFVAVDYPEIKKSMSPQKLMKLKEKAELWDQYAIYDDDNEPKILVKDLITAYETLEAVKTWLIKAKAEGRISMNVGFSLGLVLGVEE